MEKGRVSGEILHGIHKNCKNDIVIEQLLRDLLFEESEHLGQWRWKAKYKEVIEKHIERWGGNDED